MTLFSQRISKLFINLKPTRLFATLRPNAGAALIALTILMLGFSASYSPKVHAIPVDTAGTAMSGLWNIDAESGWGASVVHQYGTMFITIYTFDGNRNPIWYAATNCVVANDRCRDAGMLRISNGDAVTSTWTGNRNIVPVGSLEMIFNTINGATMNFVVDGRSGTKNVSRSLFASPPTLPIPPSTNGIPFDFGVVKVTSLIFTEELLGTIKACNVQITATNNGADSNFISLHFDVVSNNIVIGRIIFQRTSLRLGLTFQETTKVLGNGAFLACNQFTLSFDPSASIVSKN